MQSFYMLLENMETDSIIEDIAWKMANNGIDPEEYLMRYFEQAYPEVLLEAGWFNRAGAGVKNWWRGLSDEWAKGMGQVEKTFTQAKQMLQRLVGVLEPHQNLPETQQLMKNIQGTLQNLDQNGPLVQKANQAIMGGQSDEPVTAQAVEEPQQQSAAQQYQQTYGTTSEPTQPKTKARQGGRQTYWKPPAAPAAQSRTPTYWKQQQPF